MILLTHILIALSSILFTAYTSLHPSKTKLKVSYLFVALTLISGTYLLMLKPSHLTSTCLTGLTYLGVVMVGILAARHRLAKLTRNA